MSCLVEHLDAVDQVAFDGREADFPPFGVETLLRSPSDCVGPDRSKVAQPMHGLGVVR